MAALEGEGVGGEKGVRVAMVVVAAGKATVDNSHHAIISCECGLHAVDAQVWHVGQQLVHTGMIGSPRAEAHCDAVCWPWA